jgi:hypothetical protein
MACRLRGQYSRAPMLLSPVDTNVNVSVYTTIAIIPVCAFTYVRVLTAELIVVWVSDSYPAFFLLIATTSNENF